MIITLKYCELKRINNEVITTFHDGTHVQAQLINTPWHRQIWEWVGCKDDGHRYNWEHEFIHSFISEKMWDAPSYVLWGEAHGKKLSVVGAKFEERWCYHFHRYLNQVADALESEWGAWRAEAWHKLGLFSVNVKTTVENV